MQHFRVDHRRFVIAGNVHAELCDGLRHVGLEDPALLEESGRAKPKTLFTKAIACDRLRCWRTTDVGGAHKKYLRHRQWDIIRLDWLIGHYLDPPRASGKASTVIPDHPDRLFGS